MSAPGAWASNNWPQRFAGKILHALVIQTKLSYVNAIVFRAWQSSDRFHACRRVAYCFLHSENLRMLANISTVV
jgi:hypothetical protein